jgi:predicted dehydrogenase
MTAISRRTFLGSAAAVTALAGAGARGADANDRINVGIIGCRNRGPQVAEAMQKAGQFNITTFCDCDEGMIAMAMLNSMDWIEKKPAKETDFRRLLDNPDIDAVVIATPDHWHAQMTAMALDAGKHVYVEKPASYNIFDGKAMAAAQDQHPDLMVQVGTQQRSGEHFQDAKAFIQEGGLGRIGFTRACIIHQRPFLKKVPDSKPPEKLDYEMWTGPAALEPYNENRVHYNWHFMRNYGTGEMGNWGAHWIDIVLWTLGLDYPSSVAGMGGQYVMQDIKEWPDTQTTLFHFPEMTLLWEQRLWSKFGIGGQGCHCEFHGEKGAIVISRKGWTFHPKDGKPEWHDGTELEVNHAANFAKAIRGEEKPAAPMHEGHKTAVCCHLSNITATVNRMVNFDGAAQAITGDPEAEAMMRRDYRNPWKLEDYVKI